MKTVKVLQKPTLDRRHLTAPDVSDLLNSDDPTEWRYLEFFVSWHELNTLALCSYKMHWRDIFVLRTSCIMKLVSSVVDTTVKTTPGIRLRSQKLPREFPLAFVSCPVDFTSKRRLRPAENFATPKVRQIFSAV